MWRPNNRQWWVLWVTALAIVLLWPTGGGRSLAVKSINFIADPSHTLPVMPPPLPMELGDDGFAVVRHDEMERAYREATRGTWLMRLRLRLRDLEDPFDPRTQEQVVLAIVVLGGLLTWRLGADKRGASSAKETGAG